jgi:purine-nucleoside phosphorylase
MLAQISFTADEKLKEKTMRKAKEKGVTLKSVLIFSMEAFANEKINLGIIPSNEDVEELKFDSHSIKAKSEKLASLLK